jgi:hypothetical protein
MPEKWIVDSTAPRRHNAWQNLFPFQQRKIFSVHISVADDFLETHAHIGCSVLKFGSWNKSREERTLMAFQFTCFWRKKQKSSERNCSVLVNKEWNRYDEEANDGAIGEALYTHKFLHPNSGVWDSGSRRKSHTAEHFVIFEQESGLMVCSNVDFRQNKPSHGIAIEGFPAHLTILTPIPKHQRPKPWHREVLNLKIPKQRPIMIASWGFELQTADTHADPCPQIFRTT